MIRAWEANLYTRGAEREGAHIGMSIRAHPPGVFQLSL